LNTGQPPPYSPPEAVSLLPWRDPQQTNPSATHLQQTHLQQTNPSSQTHLQKFGVKFVFLDGTGQQNLSKIFHLTSQKKRRGREGESTEKWGRKIMGLGKNQK
jgi:hypothetical protein